VQFVPDVGADFIRFGPAEAIRDLEPAMIYKVINVFWTQDLVFRL